MHHFRAIVQVEQISDVDRHFGIVFQGISNRHGSGGSGLDFGDSLGNFIYEAGQPHQLLRVPKVGVCRSGTGDVFASILIADAVNGGAFSDSVAKAAEFISHALKRTTEMDIPRTDGICFEEILGELIPRQ